MLEVIRICTLRSNSYVGSASALPDMENLHGKHLQAREIGTEGALFTLSKHSSSSWQVNMEIARGGGGGSLSHRACISLPSETGLKNLDCLF